MPKTCCSALQWHPAESFIYLQSNCTVSATKDWNKPNIPRLKVSQNGGRFFPVCEAPASDGKAARGVLCWAGRRAGAGPPWGRRAGKHHVLLELNRVLARNRARRKSNGLSKGNPSALTLSCFLLERQLRGQAARGTRQGKARVL